MKIEQILCLVQSSLSQKRQEHTMAVAKLAEELAQQYHVPVQDAKLAAILHDITKEEDETVQLQTIEKSDIILNIVFQENANLYHGLTAFLYARDILKIENEDVLNAIRFHTTGREDMSMLEKIIFVSDATAYDRHYSNVAELRKLSFEDIDKAMIRIIDFTIGMLLKKKQLIAVEMLHCYNQLLMQR